MFKTLLGAVLTLMLLLAISMTGVNCCSAKYNQPLIDTSHISKDTAVVNQDDQTLMYICFSGGGTRAMSMGYYVVDALAHVSYKTYANYSKEDTTTLRDEIDYTSGVSGGAFVSAALAAYPQAQWTTFYHVGVENNLQGKIIKKLLEIKNWPFLLSPYYNRTDLASEFYDRRVFKHLTFGQLPARPVVYINSTVLASNSHLVFTDEYFRYINSDIRSYPLGFACAASSAFPGGFAPMTLKNYNRTYMSEDSLRHNPRYRLAVANSYSDIEQRAWANTYRFLKDTSNQWLHVSDGGIAGNTGIERVLDAWRTNGVINKAINNSQRPLKRLIIMVVNAGADKPDESCRKRVAPGILKTVLYTTTISMDLLSDTRMAQLHTRVEELCSAIRQANGHDPALAQLEEPYLIELNAQNLENTALKHEFNNISTSLSLSGAQLNTVHQVVQELLKNNAEYSRLLQNINNK